MALLTCSSHSLFPGHTAYGGALARAMVGKATPSRAALRLAQFVLLALCKLALVLTVAQVPSDVVGADAVETAKQATEDCLLTEARSEMGCLRPAGVRCGALVSLRTSSVQVAQRAASRGHAHGHLLDNGLRAPLRC